MTAFRTDWCGSSDRRAAYRPASAIPADVAPCKDGGPGPRTGMEPNMTNSNHARVLRRAQRKGDELRDELRRIGQRLATDLDFDEDTVQRLEMITRRVARHVVTLQVLEECTPEPAAEPVPVAPEPQGPRYAVEVTATAGLDVAHAAIQRRLAGGDE